MNEATVMMALVIVAALAFDFVNGFHDCANAIATSVSTRVLSPRTAILLAAVLNFAGAFAGTAVAKAVGSGIVETAQITQGIVLSALLAAIVWNLATWLLGLPTSSSHALIGSLIGAAYAAKGAGVLVGHGIVQKILLPLVLSPLVGFGVAFLWMAILMWLNRRTGVTRVRDRFTIPQIASAAFMAFSHGSNDAQKVMGVITAALIAGGFQSEFVVPVWVIAACATAMAFGTAAGGWRIIRTVGSRITDLQPIHGFAAESTAGIVLLGTAHFGLPVSTTHVISSAIMGVGATRKLSAVRWGVAGNILLAWVLTLPICAALAAGFSLLFGLLQG